MDELPAGTLDESRRGVAFDGELGVLWLELNTKSHLHVSIRSRGIEPCGAAGGWSQVRLLARLAQFEVRRSTSRVIGRAHDS